MSATSVASTAKIANISVLSPLVTRILGLNPGKFTLQGTNTYLVGRGKQRVLIDTGEGKPEYLEQLAKYAETVGFEISAIMLTHWHGDHIGGVQGILEHSKLGKLSSSLPKAFSNGIAINNTKPTVYKFRLDDEEDAALTPIEPQPHWTHPSLNKAGRLCDSRYSWDFQGVEDGQRFQFDGFTLTGFHTPGHAADHMVYWLEEERTLFSGDNVLGEGTTVFENLKEYMESLERMTKIISRASQELAAKAKATTTMTTRPKIRIYPGHGNLIEDGQSKIEEYIGHRTLRENEILRMLDSHHRERGLQESLTVPDIVGVIYKGYPQNLHMAAARGVSLHLDKLVHDNKVVPELGGARWRLRELLDEPKL